MRSITRNGTKIAFFVAMLCLSTYANADGNAQSSSMGGSAESSSVSQGGNGFGGDSSSISHGGDGGAGGNGFGGMGGTGMGGSGTGGQGGSGTGGSASNSGNAQSLHFDQVRQSPSVFMSAPAPTAGCQATLGGFLSFIGGIGLAGSRTLEECEKRESSRLAYAIGQSAIALEILCMTKYGSQTVGCRNNK